MHRNSALHPSDAGPPDTMVARFIDRASRDPERRVFCTFPLGAMKPLHTLSWGDWITASRGVAGALLALHLEPGTRVAVFSDNRTLWPITIMGAFFAGCTVVAIAPDTSSEKIVAQLNAANASVLIIDTVARFKRVRAVQGQLLRPLVLVCDDLEPMRSSAAEGIFEFEGWYRSGESTLQVFPLLDDRLRERINAVAASDAAILFFPEDAPAGVIIPHHALLASAAALADRVKLSYTDHVACYRPLSDPVEQILGVHATVLAGGATGLVEHGADAFTAARQLEATLFSAAPRALSIIRETLAAARAEGTYMRDAICALLGRHCRVVVWGAERVTPDFEKNLRDGSVSAASIFGVANQACVLMNGPHTFEASALGTPFPGVETRTNKFGELEIRRGPLTFTQVSRAGAETSDASAAQGVPEWFSAGLRVEALSSGAYRQTGHMHELLHFANGHAVPATFVECALGALPMVAHAVCEADGANAVVAVLSLDRRATEQWAATHGLRLPWEALAMHPLVHEALAQGVAQVNAALDAETENKAHVAAFMPTELEFSATGGELMPDQTLNRSVVANRFRHAFADLRRGLVG